MKPSLPTCVLALLCASASAQTTLYDQPMTPGGGTLRHSQLWVDPSGQNDSDLDSIAWDDFQLPQDSLVTHISWSGQAAPPLGFMVSFFHQDPNTIAVQPDIFAAGSEPISEETYTNFTQVPLGNGLVRFDVDLVEPLAFLGETRYFLSVVGLMPLPFATWDWAANNTGPNGTFWWQRGAHMYFHLGESRALSLSGSVVGCPTPTVFCTTKLNSQGCSPAIAFQGWPSMTSSAPFPITASAVLNQRNGLLFYGYGSTLGIPFLGGTLCALPPLRRTSIHNAGGSAPPTLDCSGTYTFDFNAHLQSGADPFLLAGSTITAQWWSRDPQHPDATGAGLTDAVGFVVCP